MKNLLKFKSVLAALCIMAIGLTVNAQEFNWARQMGGRGFEIAEETATDRDGNVYIAGHFANKDTTDFNIGGTGGQFRNTGVSNDVFLAKYNPGGEFIWAKALGGIDMEQCYNVATDHNNNVYITGRFYSVFSDFNPGGTGGTLMNSAPGFYDMFIAKYDANGNFQWVNSMGGAYWEEGWGIAADGSGNVFVTGRFSSPTATFSNSSNTLTRVGTGTHISNLDAFLVKYDSSGNYVWSKSMGSPGLDYGFEVAVDASGNAYIAGTYSNGIDFGGGPMTSAGDADIFIAKYDANGNHLWSKGMGGKVADECYAVATDASGNVFITGAYTDTANFNRGGSGGILVAPLLATPWYTAYFPHGYVAKYDSTGNFVWVKSIVGKPVDATGSSYIRGYDVTTDASGNIYASFGFQGDSVNITPNGTATWIKRSGPSSQTAIMNGLIMKYDPEGNYQWVKHLSGTATGTGDAQPKGIALDHSGNVYSTGYYGYNNSVSIRYDSAYMNPGGSNPGLLPGMGIADVFLVRFGCNDTSSSQFAESIACGDSFTLKDNIFTATGIYTVTFPNVSGCDSFVTLDLTVIPIEEPIISVDSFTLSTKGGFASYQWIFNGKAIEGATDTFYNITANGIYQVTVTNEFGCSVTSDFYPVTNYTSIDDVHLLAGHIQIYPNPAADALYIQSPVKINAVLADITGKVIRKVEDARRMSLKDLSSGIYMLQIRDTGGTLIKVEKVVKEE